MTKNIKKAVGLTSAFVSLPETKIIAIIIVALSLLFGLGMNIGKLGGSKLIIKSVFQGLLLLGIPGFLSAIFVKILGRKKVEMKGTLTISMISIIIYGAGYMTSRILPEGWNLLPIVLAYAITFSIWYYSFRIVFSFKYRSLLFAFLQSIIFIVFLFSTSIVEISQEPTQVIAKFYIAIALFLSALYIFFQILNAPMKRNFGISSMDALSSFIAQWLFNEKELEEAFEEVGEKAVVPIVVLSFKRGKEITHFITPYIHFGPFGNLGGSEFSYKIAEEIEKKYGEKAFVFHSTATHDLNPVNSKEINKILQAFERIRKKEKFAKTTAGFSKGKWKECFSEILKIDDALFISLSRAPKVTEDIHIGAGIPIMIEGEKKANVVCVVDQHNAETGEITSFDPGSKIAYKYLKAAKEGLRKRIKEKTLSCGFKEIRIKAKGKGIGKGGIKIAYFKTEPEYVIILIDSNGITPEFREKVIEEIKTKIKENLEVGIFTTDTHQTNAVRGVSNPVEEDKYILKVIVEGVKEAKRDVKECEFSAGKEWMEIKVLGAKQSIEIISTVNSIVAVAKVVGPIIVISAILGLIYVITKI